MGITVKFMNESIIYKRDPGTKLYRGDALISFCPIRGCQKRLYYSYVVTMTDSGGNGWDSNILGFKQNGNVTAIFGDSFTSGSTSGPAYIILKPDSEVLLIVNQTGTNTDEIGFVVKTTNGELLHERKPGTRFTPGTIFKRFCPGRRCGKSNYVTLAVTMTDSGGDGWNNNILVFKQDGQIVEYFGSTFTSGSTGIPVYITLKGNLQTPTQITVYQLGTKSQQISFTVKSPNGTIIHQRSSGTAFTPTTIFNSFCPLRCPTYSSYSITTTSMLQRGGWLYGLLGIYQDSVCVVYVGFSEKSFEVFLEDGVEAAIVAYNVDNYDTHFMGLEVKDSDQNSVYSLSQNTYFFEKSILKLFCPIGVCPAKSNYITLTITMQDTGGNGWQYNYFSLVQSNKIVNTFGQQFQSGSEFTTHITIQADLEATIYHYRQGSNSNEVGFEIKAPNGSLIYKRSPGGSVGNLELMTAFCVVGDCDDGVLQGLVVEMTDVGGDGWNDNILTITQNNTLITTFGSSFTSGSTAPKIYTVLSLYSTFEVSVAQVGTKTEEVGFVVRNFNGDVLMERLPGEMFYEGTVFGSVCSKEPCGRRDYTKLTVKMTDSGADGWDSNVLAFKQNNQIVGTFGNTFTSGSQKTVYITMKGNQPDPTQIIVHQLGTKTSQIGFTITSPNGTTIYQHSPGTSFTSSTIFTTFCPVRCPTLITLTIQMSSSFGTGWSRNILSLTQNKKKSLLGKDFDYGDTAPAVSLQFQDCLEVVLEFFQFQSLFQITIGLTITSQNSTKIYSQPSSSPVSPDSIYTTFCLGTCPTFNLLTITMTDSGADGWNGNVLGLVQDGDVVGVFGREFRHGVERDGVGVRVQEGLGVGIVVLSYGVKTEEIGFVIRAEDGTIVYERKSGTAFNANQDFGNLCPFSGCPITKNQLTLTISMTGTSGSNSNIFAIKQEGTIVDTFGSAFTSGTSSDPVTITVAGDKEVQVVVSSLGTNTEQIGFTIAAPNGTIIYQRMAGSPFYAGTIFSVFCPVDGCPASNYLKLTTTMTDSGSDGWNGNILAIKQSGVVVGTFGNAFTSGKTGTAVNIIVEGNKGVQIVVQTLGTKTNELGFTVKSPNGTVVHQRTSGTAFLANNVFATFCLVDNCDDLIMLAVMMTDTAGDGWNYNVIGVKQNGVIVGTFGSTFKTGYSSGPVFIPIYPNERTQIAVYQLGLKTNEMGFVIKDETGNPVVTKNTGTTFTYNTVFSYFCPDSCSNAFFLTIAMTDSGSDGWNSNVLVIKQDGAIAGTFGGTFTSGGSSAPVTITVQGDKEVQIVVSQLGTKTEEIGFSITAPNGTVIYQRASGLQFYSGTVLSLFCPIDGCSSTNYFKMTVTMTDTGSDGWNNNVLAVKQNGAVVDTFGTTFKSGSSSGPVTIILQGNVGAQIIVAQLGTKTEEMTFIARAPNNTIISQKYSGTTFAANNVFATFCPVNSCADLLLLEVTMTDTFGDGWNYNIIGIKQNGALVGSFGSAFKTGSSSGPLFIPILPNERTHIAVYQLGLKTNEIGFVVKDPDGKIVCSRTSGTTFTYTTVFSYFCPASCVNTLTLNIAMTDSGNDGWNGNILAIKQEGAIVGTFGSTFSSGGSTVPTSITVQGDKEVQITVSTLGTKTEEVGFTVTASNGTVIHQRSSGVAFPAGDIFLNFCPFGGCPTTNFLTLGITMTDSVGDGWNGIVLAVKQNNVIVGTFGDTFTSGSASGPVFITVQGNIETRMVFSQYSSKVNQIGFIITASNGTTIFRKYTGTTYLSNKIFSTFCPIANCPSNPNVDYSMTLTDSGGNGWEGTILAFKQNGAVLSTISMTSGASNGPKTVTFPVYATISIVVSTMGTNSHQVGIKIVNSYGETVFEKTPGVRLYISTPLGSFCAECVNLSPVSTVVGSSGIRTVEGSSYYEANDSDMNEIPLEQNRELMIAAYVLASALIILSAVSVLYFLRKRKSLQSMPASSTLPSSSASISASTSSVTPQTQKNAEIQNMQSAQNLQKSYLNQNCDKMDNI